MKNLLRVFSLSVFLLSFYGASAQTLVSGGATFGYASPNGSGVGETAGLIDVDGGISYSLLGYYHPSDFKLGFGVHVSASVLASVDTGLDAYGLAVYALSTRYNLKEEGFTPFASLGVGLMQLSTPSVSSGGVVLVEAKKGSALAIQPTVGLSFGGFQLSVDYLVPGKITIDGVTADNKIGYLTYNLGYVLKLEL